MTTKTATTATAAKTTDTPKAAEPETTTTAPKSTSATQVAAKAARDAQKAATAEQVLAWLTAHANTFFAVRDVELGTGNGPETANVKTLRPTLWALVEKGLVVAGPTAAGRKGFAVQAAPVAAKKAAASK